MKKILAFLMLVTFAPIHGTCGETGALVSAPDPSNAHEAEELEPSRVHIRKGIRYFRERRYSRALLEFNWAVLADPRSATAHFHLAAAHFKLGRYQAAMQEVIQCLALDPSHRGGRYLRGMLYERTGAGSKALALYGELAGNGQENSFARFALRKLMAPPPPARLAAINGCLRSVTGFSRGRVETPGAPDLRGIYQEMSVQLNGGPYAGEAMAAFFVATGLARHQQTNGTFGDNWANLGASLNPSLSENLALYGSYDLFQVRHLGTVPYRHHQATLAGQLRRFAIDLVQAQGQVMREEYPVNRDADATVFVLSLLVERETPFRGTLQLSGSLRWSTAREDHYDHRQRGTRLSWRRGGWGSWGLTVGLRHQRLEYPRYPSGWETIRRVDWETGMEVEVQVPLNRQLSWVVGDGLIWNRSSQVGGRNCLHQGFTGMSWFY